MKKYCIKGLLGLATVTGMSAPTFAEGNRSETKYFSAEIVNVRRANTGNVVVTIKFVPKIDEATSLYIYSDIKQQRPDVPCPNNQTVLIDGNGDEHTARNCLPAYSFNSGAFLERDQQYSGGMQLHAGSEASFVYKFGFAGASSESYKGMSITIPMRYNYCYEQKSSSPTGPLWTKCDPSLINLSFYGIDAI